MNKYKDGFYFKNEYETVKPVSMNLAIFCFTLTLDVDFRTNRKDNELKEIK